MPAMIYGTAYKRHATSEIVERALRAGFLGVDTATFEGKRYNDTGVGEALSRVNSSSYIQLKIHHIRKRRDVSTRTIVSHSFARGLENLGVDRVDVLLLRGPSPQALKTGKLSSEDVEAWRTMSDVVRSGKAKLLGLCNFSPRLVDRIIELGQVRPAVLQTKCHANTAWARQVRDYCDRKGIVLQAPSLLTSNRQSLKRGSPAHRISFEKRSSPERVVLRFALQLGIVPIVGTSSELHIQDNLKALEDAEQLTLKQMTLLERASILSADPKLAAEARLV